MKKIRSFICLIIAFSIVLVSCEKDENNEVENNSLTNSGTMSLKYDGMDWSATLAVQAISSQGVINITGSDGNAHQCSIVLYGANTEGSYSIGGSLSNTNLGIWTEGLGENMSYTASNILGSGSVTINELSETKISGTFSFTAYNTDGQKKEITGGEFSANF